MPDRLGRLASEFCVSKAFAANLGHDQREAVGIIQGVVFRSTIVKPETCSVT
jgi:hypothetical protein